MGVPTIKDLQIADRRKTLTADEKSPFVQAIGMMPVKRRELVLAMLADPQATLCEQAKSAGLTVSQANSAFREIAGKLGPALLRLGGTEADLVKVLMDGLRAEKITTVKVGDDIQLVRTPDMPVRLAAFKEACKLGGYYPNPKIEIDKKEERTYGLTAKTIDALVDREKRQQQVPASYEVAP
jgi:hypothetical protein